MRDFGPLIEAPLGSAALEGGCGARAHSSQVSAAISRRLEIEPGATRGEVEARSGRPRKRRSRGALAPPGRSGRTRTRARAADSRRSRARARPSGSRPMPNCFSPRTRRESLRARKSLSSAAARNADPGARGGAAGRGRASVAPPRPPAARSRRASAACPVRARGAIRARFAKLKSERAALDFDDLIASTRRLLARASAAFVLYKLDAAIEHLLVDEAQDTNFEYWAILRALTSEFTAGSGARAGRPRTVFAVGDEKQSIYGFQGAEPKIFGEMRDLFAKDYRALALEEARELYRKITLNLSFRSTQDVLSAVDAVFELEAAFRGVDRRRPPPARPYRHPPRRARQRRSLARRPRRTRPSTVNPFRAARARRLAGERRGQARAPHRRRSEALDARGLRPRSRGAGGRRADPGAPARQDIRGGHPGAETRRRPVAGADRLSLSTHIAVEDLVAAGRAALLPEDDLTLAALLKSPLVGLDDEDLQRIAPARKGSLRRALREAASSDPRLAAADAAARRDAGGGAGQRRRSAFTRSFWARGRAARRSPRGSAPRPRRRATRCCASRSPMNEAAKLRFPASSTPWKRAAPTSNATFRRRAARSA